MNRDRRDALRYAAATDAMGWRAADVAWASAPAEPVWHDAAGTPVVPVEAWRPDLDEGQCARVIEALVGKGRDFALEGTARGYTARFGDVSRAHRERRLAILLAATGLDADP